MVSESESTKNMDMEELVRAVNSSSGLDRASLNSPAVAALVRRALIPQTDTTESSSWSAAKAKTALALITTAACSKPGRGSSPERVWVTQFVPELLLLATLKNNNITNNIRTIVSDASEDRNPPELPPILAEATEVAAQAKSAIVTIYGAIAANEPVVYGTARVPELKLGSIYHARPGTGSSSASGSYHHSRTNSSVMPVTAAGLRALTSTSVANGGTSATSSASSLVGACHPIYESGIVLKRSVRAAMSAALLDVYAAVSLPQLDSQGLAAGCNALLLLCVAGFPNWCSSISTAATVAAAAAAAAAASERTAVNDVLLSHMATVGRVASFGGCLSKGQALLTAARDRAAYEGMSAAQIVCTAALTSTAAAAAASSTTAKTAAAADVGSNDEKRTLLLAGLPRFDQQHRGM
eukprot:UC1_evm1s1773